MIMKIVVFHMIAPRLLILIVLLLIKTPILPEKYSINSLMLTDEPY